YTHMEWYPRSMFRRPREYMVRVAKLYKGHVSGWLLAVIAIAVCIAAALFVDDPSKSAMVVRSAAGLTVAAGAWLLLVAEYDAWRMECDAKVHAQEELARRLAPKAIIQNLASRVWPAGQAGVDVTGKEYYFDVFNC